MSGQTQQSHQAKAAPSSCAEQSAQQPMEILDDVSILVRASKLDEARTREIASFARERGQSVIELLVDREGVDEAGLIAGIARLLGMPSLLDPPKTLDADALKKVPPAMAIRHHVMPLGLKDGRLQLACWDPFDWQGWDDLRHLLGCPIDRVLSPRLVIDRLLKAHYGIGADTVQRILAGRSESAQASVLRTGSINLSEEEAANEPTVVNLVNQILTEAIKANATDIHFEPYETKYRVRYRIDGMLDDVSIPASVKMLRLALVSRIKIMSNLDITEKRLPQDGRCQVSLCGQDYDLRVSILPGVHGEAVVIRLQSRQMAKLDLETLGFEAQEKTKITQLVSRPHGLMLVTGPTGSGKTTTLYSCLNKICTSDTKVITIEDPVEYRMDNILQMQVHDEIGFDFARALRGMLRHDPDIMLVGEIRDRETADIAIRSALTGHLVFATLHTNDAAGAVSRLIDIGTEPFLVASSVHGILSQRLVRKVCERCKKQIDAATLGEFEMAILKDAGLDGKPIWQGAGCEKCRFTGYRGRVAIGEVLMVSPAIRQLIQKREMAESIKAAACREGMRTLRETAMMALAAGTTSIAEVLRVTQEDF